jgi:hypothetical protein
MENLPTITASDVERYQQLRQLTRRLSDALTKTIPHEAIQEVGNALGIMRNGILLLDTMDVLSVLADSCLFDWIEDGKNLVEKYVEAHPSTPGTDEHLLLQAYCSARYRLLLPKAIKPSAAIYCLDTLSGEYIVLMDIALSQSIGCGVLALFATRTVPLGSYWITTGAALPIGDRRTGEMVIKKIQRGNLLEDRTPAGEHKLATAVIRACLDCGAVEHIHYEGVQEEEGDEEEQDTVTSASEVKGPRRHVGRNDPCPCGSGKKYKRCCLRK